MNLEFVPDVTAVGGHGVDRQIQLLGNLFIGKTFGDMAYYFFLAFGERLELLFV